MEYSKKSVKKTKTVKNLKYKINSNTGSKKNKTNDNKNPKKHNLKKKSFKGGYYEDEEYSTERGLFDSLKVNSNSSAKERQDPPDFPNCCIS